MILFARVFSTTAGRWVRITLMALFALASSCSRESENAYAPQFADQPAARVTEYVFAVHPLHNPGRLFAVYGPIVEHLNANCRGIRFRLEASRKHGQLVQGHGAADGKCWPQSTENAIVLINMRLPPFLI